MKSILKISLTAWLIAFSAHAFAQETDTTSYQDENTEGRYDADTYGREENTSFDDVYNTDTTGYATGDREQQGEDTYNNTENETEYSNEPSDSIDSRVQYPVENDGNRYNEQDKARNYPGDDMMTDESVEDHRSDNRAYDERTDRINPSGVTDQYYDTLGADGDNNDSSSTDARKSDDSSEYKRDADVRSDDGDVIENPKNDRDEFPETPAGEINQESGTDTYDKESTLHDRSDPMLQRGNDSRKPMREADESGYIRKDSLGNETNLNDEIVPSDDSVYRQTRQELRHATDTLDYKSKRNADPEKVGKKVEHVADTVHSNMRDREKEKHGIE